MKFKFKGYIDKFAFFLSPPLLLRLFVNVDCWNIIAIKTIIIIIIKILQLVRIYLVYVFQYAGDDADKLAGLVSYCDMTNGRAMFIEIRGNIVCAGLKTLEHNIASNCTERTVRHQPSGDA